MTHDIGPGMAELPMTTIIILAAMTSGAAVIRGLTGFGMAIILVPLLGLVIPPAQAVVLAILLQLLIGPVGLRTILADADRASALRIAGVATVVTPLGLWLLTQTPPDLARLLIAIVAIAAFLLVLLPPSEAGLPPGRATTVVTGAASGMLTGFAAMPGPPVIPYYLRQRIAPRVARASMMLVFFGTAIAGTLSAFAMGRVTRATMVMAGGLFIPMVIGNWVGGLAFGRIPPRIWRTLVAVVLGVAAASAVGRLLS